MEINESLNNFSFGFTADGKPGFSTGGASTEIIPFKSGSSVIKQACGVASNTNINIEKGIYTLILSSAMTSNAINPTCTLNSADGVIEETVRQVADNSVTFGGWNWTVKMYSLEITKSGTLTLQVDLHQNAVISYILISGNIEV